MSREEDEQASQGFKVEDRRRFSETGEARPGAVDAAASTPAQPEPANAPPPSATQHPDELTFSSFIMGLTTQVLVHLGEIPDPITKQSSADLAAARQLIDILGLLQQKTHGNLDETESELLQGMLYDLRLRFVERAKR